VYSQCPKVRIIDCRTAEDLTLDTVASIESGRRRKTDCEK
jgi:hypothetical protein